MMVGVSGTSHTGKLHCYYSFKGNWQHKCNRKNIPKDYIEDLVIEQAINYLTKENITTNAKTVVKLAEKEKNHSKLRQLEKNLKEIEKQFANKIPSIENIEGVFLEKDNSVSIVNENINSSHLGNNVLP